MPSIVEMPPTRRGSILVERTVEARDGVVRLRQRFVGDDVRVMVTHESALRSLVEVVDGALSFPLASGEIAAPRRFVLAQPPHSIVPIRFHRADVIADGIGAPRRLDAHAAPAIEDPGGALLAVLDPDAGVPPSIARARACLHEQLGCAAPVQRAAARAGIAAETLSRAFAAAYRVGPKQYCHRARLFDAAIRIFAGDSVLDAALRAGFNDLTRFYVQFRSVLGSTPGSYARLRNRQDRARARP